MKFYIYCFLLFAQCCALQVSTGVPKKYKDHRIVIYDVNAGEGFNLRRDVYMRIACALKHLNDQGHKYLLALPPFGNLPHWRDGVIAADWSTFFDTASMARYVPNIELRNAIADLTHFDKVMVLQHFAEGWGEHYEMKYEVRKCMPELLYQYRYNEKTYKWDGYFQSFSHMTANEVQCVSFQGDSRTLEKLITETPGKIIYIDHGEVVLHHNFGEVEYWNARRSMRYSKKLTAIAEKFLETNLDHDSEKFGTVLPAKWEDRKQGRTEGGPFISVHWRRRDFLRAHSKELPSIEGTAKIINTLAADHKVKKVFIATDAVIDDVERLQKLIGDIQIITYHNSSLSDGEIAIIDQYICARARYFTGSHVSTFSFRIHEDREILGFDSETTFNRMCPDKNAECEQPAKWEIVYGENRRHEL